MIAIASLLGKIDRRVVYILVAISLSLPIISGWSLEPAQMETADSFFAEVESLKAEQGNIVLIASDWGPGTQAENKPQTILAMEHLMRKRIPFALISITPLATPYLKEMPLGIAERLSKEMPGQEWKYGVDWVNFGYQPGLHVMIRGLAEAESFEEYLKTDSNGTSLSDIPVMKGVKNIRNVSMLMEFTGLVSAFNYWIQFFQTEGYQPKFVHGCTSITIPEAYIYYVSKQIVGLYEGAAGAAWYEKLLNDEFAKRKEKIALKTNTSLAVAHLVILAFMILGNIGYLLTRRGSSND